MNILEKTTLHTPFFLTEKRNLLQFLGYITLFSIFFGFVYRPIGLIRLEGILPEWNVPLYMAIFVFTGMVTIVLSRLLLSYVQKQYKPKTFVYVIWILGEVVVISLALAILANFINANKDVSFMNLISHIVLDVVAVLLVPYLLSILIFTIKEKNQEISALNAMLHQRSPEIFQSEDIINFYDKGGKLAFATKKSNVLYIEASDNYTNIHYINGDHLDCFILHSSMKQVEESYTKVGMLRCHRGYLVNLENVQLLRKDKDGLVIELFNCDKVIPVSKTYVEKVSHLFAGGQTSALV